MATQRIEIPLGSEEARHASGWVSSQSLVNCLLERDPDTGAPVVYGGPGMTLVRDVGAFVEAPGAAISGLYYTRGRLWCVCNDRLVTIGQDGLPNEIGPYPAGGDRTQFSHSDYWLMLVANGQASYYSVSPTEPDPELALINSEDFPAAGASSVGYVGGFFVFGERNSGRFFTNAAPDNDPFHPIEFNALDYATAEANADRLLRVFVDQKSVLLFGEQTLEEQYLSGAADFPFSRGPTFVEVGSAGRDCVARVDNSVAWLANDLTVRLLRGSTAQIISTHAISHEISRWTDPGRAVAFSYMVRGHDFFVLRHPDGCVTWNAATQRWTRRRSFASQTWKVTHAVAGWGGQHYFGATDGKIYRLDVAEHTEAGAPLVREIVSSTLGAGGRRFSCAALELEVEPGTATVTGQGANPQMWLQISRDGGRTWGANVYRELGPAGTGRRRIIWRRLGQFGPHGATFRLAISDPVSWTVTKAWADVIPDQP